MIGDTSVIFTCFHVIVLSFLASVIRVERLLRFQSLKRLQKTVRLVRIESVPQGQWDRIFSGYVSKISMLEL